jgi:hypothetical protein
MPANPLALSLSRTLLRLLTALNILAGIALALLLAATFAMEPRFLAYLEGLAPEADVRALLWGLRLWGLIGLLVWLPILHFVLARLRAIVETVRLGDPFVAANAVRLRAIAWALLGLQLLHLVSGLFARALSSGEIRFEWSFSLSGWLAVLLVFVLAGLFDEGARMRDELEGTV